MTDLATKAADHFERLCAEADRRPGSPANAAATAYVAEQWRGLGWLTATQTFPCLDWETHGGSIEVGGATLPVTPSPYGLGTEATGPVRVLRTLTDLRRTDLEDTVVVLTDELAGEPLTPKAFPFYGSEEHTSFINSLEAAAPAAVLAVTGKHPPLCGALDPFPLIEDGDFLIPTGNLRPDQAGPLLAADGAAATVRIRSRRWLAEAENVIARRGPEVDRLTVIAHVDTKPGTPGAVDNAAGVIVLLLLAELLDPGDGSVGVELLAVNGEDHFAAPGELAWLAENDLDHVALALNIDGAGYRSGGTHFSTYNLTEEAEDRVGAVLTNAPGLERGPAWFQSDHAIFAMQGRPAVAFTTAELEDMLDTLFHAPTDTPDQVDVRRLVEIAEAIRDLVAAWPTSPGGPVS